MTKWLSLSEMLTKRSPVVWFWNMFAIYSCFKLISPLSSWPDGHSSRSSICRRLLWKSATRESNEQTQVASILLNAWLRIGLGLMSVGETSTPCSLAKHWVECYDCSTAFWVPLSFLTVSQCCLSCSTLALRKTESRIHLWPWRTQSVLTGVVSANSGWEVFRALSGAPKQHLAPLAFPTSEPKDSANPTCSSCTLGSKYSDQTRTLTHKVGTLCFIEMLSICFF